MAKEIERKFLVVSDEWKSLIKAEWHYRQGYLSFGENGAPEVRVRLIEPPEGMPGLTEAAMTVKSKGDLVREEVEVGFDKQRARDLLAMCQGTLIEKTRYNVRDSYSNTFEVDVYEGALAGLVVAEVELPSEDAPFEHFSFLGEELTFDKRYKNAALSRDGLPSPAPSVSKMRP